MNKLNSELFFDRCNKKFNYRFKYYNDYKSIYEEIVVKCPIHGDFKILAEYHIQSKKGGCLLCQKENHLLRYSGVTEEFIVRSNIIHDNEYDYSKIKYVNNLTKVEIVCPKHGVFMMSPSCHLRGQKCQKCQRKKRHGHGGYNIKNAEKFKDKWSKIDAYLYIVEMSNDNESFIKIGITVQKNIKRRFSGSKYNINILYNIKDNLYNLIYLEREYLNRYSDYKYTTLIKFRGHTECFKKEIWEIIKST